MKKQIHDFIDKAFEEKYKYAAWVHSDPVKTFKINDLSELLNFDDVKEFIKCAFGDKAAVTFTYNPDLNLILVNYQGKKHPFAFAFKNPQY